ncbi:Uncharacterised protein [Klebsiella pneumoniae]|nr:Uncharacterised protein [Klebsiella pneumoniae]
MMSLWDALRMNMMISYQELVRTFLRTFIVESLTLLRIISLTTWNKFANHNYFPQRFLAASPMALIESKVVYGLGSILFAFM